MATALACVVLPAAISDLRTRYPSLARVAMPGMALVWLVFAIVNVRVTVPLWSDETGLWTWALREHPDSIDIKQHLLASYIDRGLRAPARDLADAIVASDAFCPYCMLNAADLALADKDPARAILALNKLKGTSALVRDARLQRGFVFARGELLELQGDSALAESAYHEVIRLQPLDPAPHMALATLLARGGADVAARAEAAVALPLFAPEQREPQRQRFERALAESASAKQMQ